MLLLITCSHFGKSNIVTKPCRRLRLKVSTYIVTKYMDDVKLITLRFAVNSHTYSM